MSRSHTVGAVRLIALLLLCSVACDESGAPLGGVSHLPAQPVQTGRVVRDFAPVHAGPGADYPLVWRLYEGSQVAVVGDAPGEDGALWRRIRLWNSHDGWLDDAAVSFAPYPAPPPPGATPPSPAPCGPSSASRAPHTPQPLTARGTVAASTALSSAPDGAGGPTALPAGAAVAVDGWVVGADGRVRYRVRGDGVAGWAAPGAVALQSADPPTRQVGGRSIVEPLRGVGMWFTLDTREHGQGAGVRVAEAAAANGLSHLYVEVATSRGGFFGARWLDELLPAARAAGVRVIGSVYVCLDDPPADLALALEVARYRTPDGLTLDGLTADIEETLVAPNVSAFGELLRHHVGDDYLLVATVYPPESWWARYYPWAALPASWNAVAPMAYWRHMEERPFTPAEVYVYIQRNLAGVRALTGRPDLPVDMLGQLFELGRPRLLGPDPPTPGEVEAAVAAARDAGAVGISFFDWTRATPAHWETLASMRW